MRLLASGEVVWMGRAPLGDRDGRVAFYLGESLGRLLPPGSLETVPDGLSERARLILDFLRVQGASFQATIHQGAGGGFPNDTTEALWELVWAGLITNDTFHPVRALFSRKEEEKQRASHEYMPAGSPAFLARLRSRRTGGNTGQGRWSSIAQRIAGTSNPAEWSAAMAQQMLVRNGIVMRETAAAEDFARRLSGCLSRAQNHGRKRLGAARHVCRGDGRGPVRQPRGGRHAS